MPIARRLLPVAFILAGCSTTPARDVESAATQTSAAIVKLHLGPSWFEYRGESLALSPEQAKKRDGLYDEDHPPRAVFWDEQMARHTASAWRLLCNECHGGKRSIAKAALIPAPPEGWPAGPAKFFAQDRPHRDIYLKILRGGDPANAGPEGPMPAFESQFSREQIWGLVYFVETASQDGTVRAQ